jgi:hypothetical protein
VEVVISAKLPDNILAHSSTFPRWDLSRRGGRGGAWWRELERLNAGERNGKLPLRICPGLYQNLTSPLTELWSLPRPAQGLNTYNNNCIIIIIEFLTS